jgi:hypothetical protein
LFWGKHLFICQFRGTVNEKGLQTPALLRSTAVPETLSCPFHLDLFE